MTIHTQNWPDPKRPGVPMFPERDGWHWLSWGATQELVPFRWVHEDFSDAETEWYWETDDDQTDAHKMAQDFQYHGPVLTPTQINEMLAAERERCAGAIDHLKNEERGLYATGLMTTRAEITIRALASAADEIRNLGAAP